MEKSRRNNVILSDDQSNVREYDHENYFHKGFFDKVQGAFGEEVVSSKIQKGVCSVVEVTFHCFLKDSDVSSLWLNLLGMRETVISKRAYLCSMHVEETSFYT